MLSDTLQLQDKKVAGIAERAKVPSPIWSYAWYLVGLPVILGLSAYFIWGDFNIRPKTFPMGSLVGALYIGIWANKYQTNHHFSYRAIGMSVFYTTAGFLVIFAILAMGRFYYSRGFLLSAYGLSVIWVFWGTIFFQKENRQYIVIKGGLADPLRRIAKRGWEYLDNLGDVSDIGDYDGVVVDLHVHDNKKMLKALADSSLHGVPVLHAATVLENYTGRSNLTYLAQEGIFELEQAKSYRIFKRIWEIALIVILSPLIVPLAAVTAIAIKTGSRGPVLFTQKRIGKDDELFTLYKFRSMYMDAEENGSQFADKEDDRITKVGRIIRKFRIDELPQFWNVLKGDMSLIGPRPEQENFVDLFKKEIPFYSFRHKVRPGITGWAQIRNGYAANLQATAEKLEHDLYYIKNISLSFDLLIVFATVKTILTGYGSR